MTEGLDLHLGVDKAAGFVGRALETALRGLGRGAAARGARGRTADRTTSQPGGGAGAERRRLLTRAHEQAAAPGRDASSRWPVREPRRLS